MVSSDLRSRVLATIEVRLVQRRPPLKGNPVLQQAALSEYEHACRSVRELLRDAAVSAKALQAQRVTLERLGNGRHVTVASDFNAELCEKLAVQMKAIAESMVGTLELGESLQQELIAALYAETS